MNPQSGVSPQTLTYQNGLGADLKHSSREARVNTDMPSWFPINFDTSLTALIKPPYRVPVSAAQQGTTGVTKSLAEVFAENSNANPADAFKLMKIKNQLTAQDAMRAAQIIRQSLAYAAKQSSSRINSDTSDLTKSKGTVIAGYPQDDGDGIMVPVHKPPQLEEITDKYKSTLAMIAPYVDWRQALWSFNLARGLGGDGDDNVTVNAELSKAPLFSVAQIVANERPHNRKQLLLNTLGRQIKIAQNLPASVKNFSAFATAKNVADKHKYYLANKYQIRRNVASRFGPAYS